MKRIPTESAIVSGATSSANGFKMVKRLLYILEVHKPATPGDMPVWHTLVK